MDLTDEQRLELWGQVIGSVVLIEISCGGLDKKKLFGGVVIDKHTILTCSLREELQVECIAVRFIEQNEGVNVIAKHPNEFITLLKPTDASVDLPSCAEVCACPIIQFGQEVYSFSHVEQLDYIFSHCFLRGEVSHPMRFNNQDEGIAIFEVCNLHATCLGGPIFNSCGSLIGIICKQQNSFDMGINVGLLSFILKENGVEVNVMVETGVNTRMDQMTSSSRIFEQSPKVPPLYLTMVQSIVKLFDIMLIPKVGSEESGESTPASRSFLKPEEVQAEIAKIIEHQKLSLRKAQKTLMERAVVTAGAGVVINSNYILTVAHVLENALNEMIKFRTYSDQEGEAKVVALDRDADLALLEITKDTDLLLTSAKLGIPNDVKVGYSVFTIGHPLGGECDFSFSGGHIAYPERITHIYTRKNDAGSSFIQVVNTHSLSGSSGGPVFLNSGLIVGLVSHGFGQLHDFDMVVHIKTIINFIAEFKWKRQEESKESAKPVQPKNHNQRLVC